ncbi:ATP-dependent nuclease [Methanocaldococcus sp. 10A]
MLINEIKKIKEFRGIKELKNPIKLSKFNILIGKNNSGKTAILESLFLFPHPRRTYKLLANRSVSVLDFISSGRNGIKSLVYKYDGLAEVDFDVTLNNKSHEWKIVVESKGTINVFKDNKKCNRFDGKFLEFLIDDQKPETSNNIEKISIDNLEIVYFPYDSTFIKALDDFLSYNEEKIIKNDIHTKVANSISEVLDEKFTEIVLKKDGWYLRREDASYIHVNDMGDGVKKVVRTMLILELLKPKLILWDDFDTAMHPSMIKNLLNYLSKGDWQVVMTTHSIDVLYYMLDLDDIEDIQIIALKKDGSDIFGHRTFSIDDIEDIIDANLDPRYVCQNFDI